MDVRVIKSIVRGLAALFVGLLGSLQLSMTGCQFAPEAALSRWVCKTHPLASLLLTFPLLFALTLLMLSRRFAAFRRPVAVLLLAAYAVYVAHQAFEFRLWSLALLAMAFGAGALGVGMRTRWGTRVTYAISALFVLYWLWGVVMAAREGVFQMSPPLEAALSLAPGITFGLLAGFCCYACRQRATSIS